MEGLFLSLLKMSIVSSYIIILVIAVRLLLKKAPKVFSYALWAIVFLKLTCPFNFESTISLIPEQVSVFSIESMILPDADVNSSQINTSGDTAVTKAVSEVQADNTVNRELSATDYLSFLWLTGMVIIMLVNLISYIKLRKKLSTAINLRNNIYMTGNIPTPFVMGILNPRIYLPVELVEEEKIYIIQHEKVHIQRHDYLIKAAAYIISCIHWYNPFVWTAFRLMNHDMEMACDEKVLQNLGSSIKKEYSGSLLSLASDGKATGGISIAFGDNNVKNRIRNVLDYKKPALWIIIASSLIVAAVCIGLFFSPIGNNDKEQTAILNNNTDAEYNNEITKDTNLAADTTDDSASTDETGLLTDADANSSTITDSAAADDITGEADSNAADDIDIDTGTDVESDPATNVEAGTGLNSSGIEEVADEIIQAYLESPKGKILKETTDSFTTAYFSGDDETAYQYLAQNAEYSNSLYHDSNGKEADVSDQLIHLLAKWYTATDTDANVQYEYEIDGEDSYTYLDLDLEYQDGSWVIIGVYLEK
ncbi:MAG: M56 family metallopeptidase [Mobilitalea sp.]